MGKQGAGREENGRTGVETGPLLIMRISVSYANCDNWITVIARYVARSN